jgi:hypothetical protein
VLGSIPLNLLCKVLNTVKYLLFSSRDQEGKVANIAKNKVKTDDKLSRILLIVL